MRLFIYVPLCGLLLACGDDSRARALFTEPTWPGTWAATGTWNLGGPFATGRTPGDAVAELVIDQIIGLAGVPGPIEESVRSWLADHFADAIKNAVDSAAPPELDQDSTLVTALSTTLATVTVDSTITLSKGTLPGSLTGQETLTEIRYDYEGTPYSIPVADLLGSAGATLQADWEGSGNNDVVTVDEHLVGLRYGELVRRIAARVMASSALDGVRDELQAAADCATVVSLILGEDTSLSISVSDFSYEMDAVELSGACDSARGLVGENVLGLFEVDSRVEVGGRVLFTDTDGDDTVDKMESDADFGGTLNVAPKVIAPRVLVHFQAERTE